MSRKALHLAWLVPLALALVVGLAYAAPDLGTNSQATSTSIAAGGKLYDKWWKEVPGATEPTNDHPLWATQTTNTRKGAETWRCKECHGWDYKGKDGAYGSGSHKTGFVGVYNAGTTKSVAELTAILKGSTNPQHDFSSVLNAEAITNLANFLKEGLIDEAQYIDYATKKPKTADVERGQQLRVSTCVICHGADGRLINFGTEAEPEYVGTIANDNPWEFLNKVRAGQPGTPSMPSAIVLGWSTQDVINLLAAAQTLPTKKEAAAESTPTPTPQPVTKLPATGGPIVPVASVAIVGMGMLAAGWTINRFGGRKGKNQTS
ncbi:MAG: hypothetical protein HY664_07645 [Chloroflexi bacterium]|nr:hypothetical protein [Chloroflexota bacterium]